MYDELGAVQFDARARVAEQMKRRAAQRIAPFARHRTRVVERDAERRVGLPCVRDHARIVGRQRHAAAIVDRAARNQPDDVEHARVVFVPSSAVGLNAEMRAG